MKKLFLLAVLFAFSTVVMAQDVITEGVITTKQTLKSDDENMQAQLAMMGDIVSTTYFKDTKSRVEVSNPMSGDVTVVSDSKTMKTLTYMDNPMLGKKFMLTDLEVPNTDTNSMKIEKGTGTKTVLGYECKEVILTYKENGNELKMILYTTDKIAPILNQQTMQYGGDIGGLPLYSEATVYQGEMKMTIITEVTEIKDEEIEDTKFSLTPPEGYTKMEGM